MIRISRQRPTGIPHGTMIATAGTTAGKTAGVMRAAVPAICLGLALALSGCGGKGKVKATPTVGNRVPVLSRIEAGTKVDTSLAAMDVVVPAPEVNTDWAQGGGTASKASGHLWLADAPKRLWTHRIPGSSPKQRLAAAPVVGLNTLFVMDTDGVVHALDADDGHEKWKQAFRLPSKNESVFGGGATFDDGSVYVTTGLGEVAAMDAATGKIKSREAGRPAARRADRRLRRGLRDDAGQPDLRAQCRRRHRPVERERLDHAERRVRRRRAGCGPGYGHRRLQLGRTRRLSL